MNSLYSAVGISKQAVHKHKQCETLFCTRLDALIIEADVLRGEHPGCGVEKMYYTLKPNWLGRDRFIEVMKELGYKLRATKSYIRTTVPACYKYPNLIEGMVLSDKNQLWQTDITYFRVGNEYWYIVLIMDVYTKRILGYQASDHLRATANLLALKMALQSCGRPITYLIHHSDRGSQYIDKTYTGLLNTNNIQISMGFKAQDNAYAERINGIIKNEYLMFKDITSLHKLKTELRKAVNHYNKKRIHRSLPMNSTPENFEKKLVHLECQKRPTVIVYAEGNPKIKWVSNPLDLLPEKTLRAPVCPMIIDS